jgi:hypothetical protein
MIPQRKSSIRNPVIFAMNFRDLNIFVLKDINPKLSVDKNIFPLKIRLIYVVKVWFFVCFVQYMEYLVDI